MIFTPNDYNQLLNWVGFVEASNGVVECLLPIFKIKLQLPEKQSTLNWYKAHIKHKINELNTFLSVIIKLVYPSDKLNVLCVFHPELKALSSSGELQLVNDVNFRVNSAAVDPEVYIVCNNQRLNNINNVLCAATYH